VAAAASGRAVARGLGVPAGPPPARSGLVPGAGGGLPASRAAARVGGGMFFGFSALIFCSTSDLLGTPFQPRSIFGCATFAFTAGGFAVGAAFKSFWGAATRSLFPCPFVSVPDLTAVVRLPAACRSIVSRWIGRLEYLFTTV